MSTRVQLTADELDILVTLLPTQHYKLKAKLQKALVIAGGKSAGRQELSGYDLFSSTGNAQPQSTQPATAIDHKITAIMNKMIADQPISDEEKQYYLSVTGLEI